MSEEDVKTRIDLFKELIKKDYSVRKARQESKLQPREYTKYHDEIWSDPEMQPFKPKPVGVVPGPDTPPSVDEATRHLTELGLGDRPKPAFEKEFDELDAKRKAMVDSAIRLLESYGRGAPGTSPVVQTPRAGSDEEKRDVFDEFESAITNFETKRAKIKETFEKMGLKVEDLYMKREEVEKVVEEARRAAGEEALDDKRIDAVSGIVREAMSQIIELFKPAVSSYFSPAPSLTEYPGGYPQNVPPETSTPSGQAPKPLKEPEK